MKKLMIIGAGGHGRVIADIAQKCGYTEICFLDDGLATQSMGLPVVGKTQEAKNYLNDYAFFVAIGNNQVREKILQSLFDMGANVVTLVHPSAVVGVCVTLGKGTAVMAGAVINPCAQVGQGVIVNTCASIDHDCIVDDYAHIAVGARVAGTVQIGKHTFLGAGAIVKNNVNICADCIIGAGAAVVNDITEAGTYVGVPAKRKV